MYDKATDNYVVRTVRVMEGFREPVDDVMVGNSVYLIEYGGKEGNIWKIILPVDSKPIANKKK
jgi:hypothetical protein